MFHISVYRENYDQPQDFVVLYFQAKPLTMPPLPLECCLLSNALKASRQRLQSPVRRSQRPELFVKGSGGTGATGTFVMVMTFFAEVFQDLRLGCWGEKMKKGVEFLALL